MRFIKFAVLAALFALPVSSADAGILSSILTLNGTADQVNTINNPVGLSGFVDQNQNNILDAGDIGFGFIASTQVTNDIVTSDPFNPNSPVGIGSGTPAAFGPNEYLAAVFSGVVNDGPLPGQTFLTAVDPTAGTGFSIPELFPDFADAGEQLDGVDNAVVAVVSGSTANGVNDLTDTDASNLGTFFTDADFELEFALGVDGGFFQSSVIAPGGVFGGGPQLGQRAALNVIDGTQGTGFASAPFIPVPVAGLFTPPEVTAADVAVDNTLVALDQPANGFQFTIESSSIRLNAVPEPSTCIAFACIGFLAMGRRRLS